MAGRLGFALLLAAGLVPGAMARAADAPAASATGDAVTHAVALMAPTQGQQAAGTVHFRREGGGVHVTGEIAGLAPNSKHGFHVHEFGDCSAPDGTSAGGHFAPEAHSHGAPNPAQHHAGDLGNVEADGTGKARVDVMVPGLSVATGERALIGRGLILHAQPDDLTTQPTGNAGGRIACGVIGVAKP